ncbi:MAG: hypothetical protein ABIN39_05490 [candidate division WOR-3 bacterium]
MKNFFLLFFIILMLLLVEILLWMKNFFLVILVFIIIIFLIFLYLSMLTENLKTFKKLLSLIFRNMDTVVLIIIKNFYYFFYILISRNNNENDIIEKKINLEKDDPIVNLFIKLIFFMDITILNIYFTEKYLNIKIKKDFDSEIYQTRYNRMIQKL